MVTAQESILMIRAVLNDSLIDETKMERIQAIVEIFYDQGEEMLGEPVVTDTPKVQ